jgi:hypothetical protein
MDEDTYTTVTEAGVTGPSWTCDDDAEAVALAEEHGFRVLDVTDAPDGGSYLVVAA